MAVRLPFAVPSHKEKKGKERKRRVKKSSEEIVTHPTFLRIWRG